MPVKSSSRNSANSDSYTSHHGAGDSGFLNADVRRDSDGYWRKDNKTFTDYDEYENYKEPDRRHWVDRQYVEPPYYVLPPNAVPEPEPYNPFVNPPNDRIPTPTPSPWAEPHQPGAVTPWPEPDTEVATDLTVKFWFKANAEELEMDLIGKVDIFPEDTVSEKHLEVLKIVAEHVALLDGDFVAWYHADGDEWFIFSVELDLDNLDNEETLGLKPVDQGKGLENFPS